VALLALVGAPGCTNDSAEPAPLPSQSSSATASATPSSTASASDSPAAAPSMPADAKGTSAKSAEAFARHYVDLINYASRTGKTRELRAASADTCKSCSAIASVVNMIYSKGGAIRSAGWQITRLTRVSDRPSRRPAINLDVTQSAEIVIAHNGAQPKRFKGGRQPMTMYLVTNEHSWAVQRLDLTA
jgi:hypothetical protein